MGIYIDIYPFFFRKFPFWGANLYISPSIYIPIRFDFFSPAEQNLYISPFIHIFQKFRACGAILYISPSIYEGGYLRTCLRGGGNLLFSTLFSARSWNCAKNRVCYRRDLAIDVRKRPKIKIFSEFREKWGRTWIRSEILWNSYKIKIHVDLFPL